MNQMELLLNLQWNVTTNTQSVQSAGSNTNSDTDSFRAMLEKRQTETPAAEQTSENTATAEETPASDETVSFQPVSDGDYVRQQELAAMLAVQPALVLEDTQTAAPVLETAVVSAPVQTVEAVAAETTAPVEQAVIPQAQPQETPVQPLAAAAERPQPQTDPVSQQPAVSEPATAAPTLEQPVQPVETAQTAEPVLNQTANANVQQQTAPVQAASSEEVSEPEAAAVQPQPLFHDLAGTPVKVSQPTVVDTQSPEMDRQLTRIVEQNLDLDGTHVEVQLSPESLGTVTIDLTRDETGVLHIALNAATDKARAILERHTSGLQGLLAQSSQSEVEVHVQRQEQSQQTRQDLTDSGSQQHQQGQQQRRDRQAGDDFLQQLRLGLTAADAQAV